VGQSGLTGGVVRWGEIRGLAHLPHIPFFPVYFGKFHSDNHRMIPFCDLLSDLAQCAFRASVLSGAIVSLSIEAGAQSSPVSLPFPSPLMVDGSFFNSQDGDTPEQEPLQLNYTLTSTSGITDGLSSGSYSYSKTGTDKATLRVNVSYSEDGCSEQSELTYQFIFSTDNTGTCTFSGTYNGIDSEDGPYSGVISQGTGTFSLVATARTVEEWRDFHFETTEGTGDAANNFDFDGDGMSNLLEYALGTSPVDPDSVINLAPTITESGGQRYLTLSITKDPGAKEINYEMEVSSQLTGQWLSGGGSTTEVSNTSTTLSVRDSTPVSPFQPRRFIRLRVSEK